MPLGFHEKFLLEQSLQHPWLFRNIVRPELYRRNGNDSERVHEYALEALGDEDALRVLHENEHLFDSPRLEISLSGKRVRPVGTAAGMDKNGDALMGLSYVYGFQESGTVIVPERVGNERPRVVADSENNDLYNAQGFPSKGKDYFLGRVSDFRLRKPDYPVYVSLCGLPLSEEGAEEVALQQMEFLLGELNPYATGFVWNPFSPNTSALKVLRTPEIFRRHAGLMEKHAAGKLRLVKMGPYEDSPDERAQYLGLVDAFLTGGGHGIVGPNTKMVPKEQVPSKKWGYPSAGRSGASLKPYRMRMVRDTLQAFPEAVIFAAGGIFDGDDAYDTFKAGATAIESYTPETYYGPGLVAKKQGRIERRLSQDGYSFLRELQSDARNGRKLLCDQR